MKTLPIQDSLPYTVDDCRWKCLAIGAAIWVPPPLVWEIAAPEYCFQSYLIAVACSMFIAVNG